MDISQLADMIIIVTAAAFITRGLIEILAEILVVVDRKIRRMKRNRDHEIWVAARRAARLETEARMRAEGRWDNFEIQDKMNAAGEAAVPGFRV